MLSLLIQCKCSYFFLRGGGGDASWHQAGTRSCKLNSIKDFAACGLYLVKEGFVHKNRLGAIGCSAGGLLVGAAINMYPDLFCAAILKVIVVLVHKYIHLLKRK